MFHKSTLSEIVNDRLTQLINNPKTPHIDSNLEKKITSLENAHVRLVDKKKFIESSNGMISLPETGFVRLPAVLAVIPVSKTTWWQGIREGRFPKPTKKFGPRISAWDVRDIRDLIESAA